MRSLHIIIFTFCLVNITAAQRGEVEKDEKIIETFRHTRVINSHSVETLQARKLDFRIVHRFGDLIGDNGGWPTFYGLETAADVSIGFEYGVTDHIMIGFSRTKGAGPLKQNINGLLKARLINQEKRGNLPFSLSVVSTMSVSTMQKSSIPNSLNFFAKGSHRLTSHMGFHMARKFSDRFSGQFNLQWTYRNIVEEGDENDLYSVGFGGRLQATRSMAVLIDATFPVLSELRTADNDYYPSAGIAFEFDTGGGHVFQLNFTNSQGIQETDYIPYTRSSWADGEFRFGFTISRLFNM